MLAEAFAPTIGLSTSPDGCGYSSSRQMRGSFKVLEKTGSIREAARATASDFVTLDSEFFRLKTIIPYSYHVTENGTWENGGRTLQDLNDPELTDGERIKRVIEVQNVMARNPSLTQAAVGSEDTGSGRNYLYLFTRDANDQNLINALAVEHQGNENEFRDFLRALSPQRNHSSVSFDKPLFFRRNDQLQITDVFKGVLDSYKDQVRKEEMKPYLTRLAHDTVDFPNLLKRHREEIDMLAKRFQEEMLSNDDVLVGLAAVVRGVSQTVEDRIGKDTRRYEARLGMKRGEVPIKDERENFQRPKEDIFFAGKRLIEKVFEPIVPVITGVVNKLVSKTKGEVERGQRKIIGELKGRTKKDDKKRRSVAKEAEKIWQKIITSLFTPLPKEERKEKEVALETIPVGKNRENTNFALIYQAQPWSEVLRREMTLSSSAKLEDDCKGREVPPGKKKIVFPSEISRTRYADFDSKNHTASISELEAVILSKRLTKEDRIEKTTVVELGSKKDKSKQVNRQGQEVIKKGFQLVLNILQESTEDSFPKEKTKERKEEEKTVSDLITVARFMAARYPEGTLSFLLEIYNRLEGREDVRGIIVVLIYSKLKEMRENNLPLLQEANILSTVLSKANFFEKRLNYLTVRLSSVLEIPLDSLNKTRLFSILYGLIFAFFDFPKIKRFYQLNIVGQLGREIPYDRDWFFEKLNCIRQRYLGNKLLKKNKLPRHAVIFYFSIPKLVGGCSTCLRVSKMPK